MTLDAADLVANAPNLTDGQGRPSNGTADWDTTAATMQPGEDRDKTVWHKVYVSSPGTCVIDHAGGAPGDTLMIIYRAVNGNAQAVSDLTMVVADDDSAGNQKARCTFTATPGVNWFYIASSLLSGGPYSGGKLNWAIPKTYQWGVTDFARSLVDSASGVSQPAKLAHIVAQNPRTLAYLAAHAASGFARPTSGVLLPRPGINR